MAASEQVQLGKLILDNNADKDAVHVAVIPVVATCELKPGEHIGIITDKIHPTHIHVGRGVKTIGIVDPYLKSNVRFGQKFYMCLYPGTITSLRHDWTHPSFAANPSITWLEKYAARIGISYEVLMEAANNWLENHTSFCLSYDTPDFVWNDNDEFWHHFEIVTKKQISHNMKECFFRCSC